MTSEKGASNCDARTAEFERDLLELKPQALREKYRAESNSHRAMLRRSDKLGMTVAPHWKEDFRAFLADMGPIPEPGWTLDRVDTTRREYGPDLCRWTDKKTQSENRSNTRWVEVDGVRMTAADFARRAGMPASTVYSALSTGREPATILDRAMPGRYSPARLTQDADIADWLDRYEKWKKRVPKAKQADAPAEVFDIIEVSRMFRSARAWLDAADFDSMNEPEEARERERLEATVQFRIVQSADLWLEAAFRALRVKNDVLASRVSRGRHKGTYADWEEYLLRPVPM